VTTGGVVEAVRQAAGGGDRTIGVAAAAVVGAALALGRLHPLAALGVVLAATTVAALAGSGRVPVALFVGVEVALFLLATVASRRVTAVAAVVTGVVLFALVRDAVGGPPTAPGALIVLVWTAFAASIGHAVHNRRDYMQALADRVERAEETREAVAHARVTEERIRIAQELHDVVAHHLAVVSVHAGLAGRSVRTAPEVAEESLGHVQASARAALDELGAVLRVLRSSATEDGTRPTPGTADLDELIESFVRTGLAIRTSMRGGPVELDPVCDLTVYRVVQESLTNAHKHGIGEQAQVEIERGPAGVDLVVSNPVPWPVHTGTVGTGYGLTGMHERVAAVGGRLSAGVHPDGVYRVIAHIPVAPTPDVSGSALPPGAHAGTAGAGTTA
jgi:signal transduction histidine kinase